MTKPRLCQNWLKFLSRAFCEIFDSLYISEVYFSQINSQIRIQESWCYSIYQQFDFLSINYSENIQSKVENILKNALTVTNRFTL